VKLIKVKISGYRRLADECEIKLDTDPVCIVGPNAAGKSSFLKALEHLNHAEEFAPNERTRVPGGEPLDPHIEARFALSETDRALLENIPEAGAVRQLMVTKYGTQVYSEPLPKPARDLEPRQEMLGKLEELGKSPWLSGVAQIEPQIEPELERLTADLLSSAIETAGSEQETLDSELATFEQFRERLGWIIREREQEGEPDGSEDDEENSVWRHWPDLPKKYKDLDSDLHQLLEHERRQHPQRLINDALNTAVPDFVPFNDLARDLRQSYDLANDDRPAEGAAIHNLFALVDSSWEQALSLIQGGDPGSIEAYEESVNERLEERAALVWQASNLRVKVRIDGSTLTILLSMQAHDYIPIENHSDGLRQFIALRAFLAHHSRDTPPIILIDEAETHLHYDAQADLVGVFEEQTDATQIIYTTHSAGCLPRDLGLGVRAIVPELVKNAKGEEVHGDHSRVINKFWTEGRGYSPLLLAMGAGAFAFSATQRGLITEGMSDALLLPSLIKEATGKDFLGYQPAPSFAEATSPEEIADLDLIASQIAVLADGDKGGEVHVERLTENGILDEQVRYLGGASDSGLSIEDLIDSTIYLNAINEQLELWHNLSFPAAQLPKKGRSHHVAQWCKAKSIELDKQIKMSKVDIAQGVLDQRGDGVQLLDEKYMQLLADLDAEVEEIFKQAPMRLKKLKDAAEAAAEKFP
jgi:energy-coupling factor transporter ATP-binding protein EcfA2